MGIRKPVHFNEDVDSDILKYANTFSNFSAYVRKLIRDDYNANKNKRRQPKEPRSKARPTPKPSERMEVALAPSQAKARTYIKNPNNPPPYRPNR